MKGYYTNTEVNHQNLLQTAKIKCSEPTLNRNQ